MKIAQLSPDFSVTPQIVPDDLASVAASGFRSVVNNRPDGEAPDQPRSDELEREARRLGLDYEHIPIVPGQLEEAQVQRLQAFLRRGRGPVLGFCRTGTRSAQLWALEQAREGGVETILSAAAQAGYDLSPLRPRLEDATCNSSHRA